MKTVIVQRLNNVEFDHQSKASVEAELLSAKHRIEAALKAIQDVPPRATISVWQTGAQIDVIVHSGGHGK